MTRKQILRMPQHKDELKSVFSQINGYHAFKQCVQEGRVEYRVATREQGKVFYFNFELAEEMGLIPAGETRAMSAELSQVLLDTFSLQVINEYDLIHGHKFPAQAIRPQTYMATRYLQLQHACRKGTTSGDGRSLWNGEFITTRGGWDISSCGTGATRLSPATHEQNKFFKTGDPTISYGCGLADLEDGLGAAVLSEIFHRQGIPTERTLLLISYPGGQSVNVRAAPNLLRPSHFFSLLRQGKHSALSEAMQVYLQREILNKNFSCNKKMRPLEDPQWAQKFLMVQSERFAKMAARFEREYIFCWLDWDGDNILMDGGIIDYGSIRQLGLYHHQYRYDDVERWSTNLIQQRQKARLLVASFAQMCDFLQTKKFRPLAQFHQHWACKKFDRHFIDHQHCTFLQQWGASQIEARWLWKMHQLTCSRFFQSAHYFETRLTQLPKRRTADGENRPAIYSLNTLIAGLPLHLALGQEISGRDFQSLMWAGTGNKRDFLKWGSEEEKNFKKYLQNHQKIVALLSHQRALSISDVNLALYHHNSSWDKQSRLTGDGLIFVIDDLLKRTKSMSFDGRWRVIQALIDQQTRADAYEQLMKSGPFARSNRLILDNLYGV